MDKQSNFDAWQQYLPIVVLSALIPFTAELALRLFERQVIEGGYFYLWLIRISYAVPKLVAIWAVGRLLTNRNSVWGAVALVAITEMIFSLPAINEMMSNDITAFIGCRILSGIGFWLLAWVVCNGQMKSMFGFLFPLATSSLTLVTWGFIYIFYQLRDVPFLAFKTEDGLESLYFIAHFFIAGLFYIMLIGFLNWLNRPKPAPPEVDLTARHTDINTWWWYYVQLIGMYAMLTAFGVLLSGQADFVANSTIKNVLMLCTGLVLPLLAWQHRRFVLSWLFQKGDKPMWVYVLMLIPGINLVLFPFLQTSWKEVSLEAAIQRVEQARKQADSRKRKWIGLVVLAVQVVLSLIPLAADTSNWEATALVVFLQAVTIVAFIYNRFLIILFSAVNTFVLLFFSYKLAAGAPQILVWQIFFWFGMSGLLHLEAFSYTQSEHFRPVEPDLLEDTPLDQV